MSDYPIDFAGVVDNGTFTWVDFGVTFDYLGANTLANAATLTIHYLETSLFIGSFSLWL